MDIRFLVALSAISIISGSFVVAIIAFSQYSRACCANPSATPLLCEGTLLIVMGLVVLRNRRRIEEIQSRLTRG